MDCFLLVVLLLFMVIFAKGITEFIVGLVVGFFLLLFLQKCYQEWRRRVELEREFEGVYRTDKVKKIIKKSTKK